MTTYDGADLFPTGFTIPDDGDAEFTANATVNAPGNLVAPVGGGPVTGLGKLF